MADLSAMRDDRSDDFVVSLIAVLVTLSHHFTLKFDVRLNVVNTGFCSVHVSEYSYSYSVFLRVPVPVIELEDISLLALFT